MIRRILDFIFVLLFVWACMTLGLWIIDSFVVPLELPGMENHIVTATLKVAISTGMVLFWLWLWREIAKKMFWRTVKTQQHFTTRSRNNNSKTKKT
jgi:hypothetical protein